MNVLKTVKVLSIVCAIITIQGCPKKDPAHPPLACNESAAESCIKNDHNTWFGFPQCKCVRDDVSTGGPGEIIADH